MENIDNLVENENEIKVEIDPEKIHDVVVILLKQLWRDIILKF